MYDGGLQDEELQKYHKELKFSVNLFLDDILEGDFEDFFETEEMGNFIKIYPLFYTDEINADSGNFFVNSPYCIMVPNDYKGLITFFGDDGQVISNKSFSISENDDFCSILIFNNKTKEFIPNQEYKIEYQNFPVEKHSTGKNGYGGFVKKEDNYNVVIL